MLAFLDLNEQIQGWLSMLFKLIGQPHSPKLLTGLILAPASHEVLSAIIVDFTILAENLMTLVLDKKELRPLNFLIDFLVKKFLLDFILKHLAATYISLER